MKMYNAFSDKPFRRKKRETTISRRTGTGSKGWWRTSIKANLILRLSLPRSVTGESGNKVSERLILRLLWKIRRADFQIVFKGTAAIDVVGKTVLFQISLKYTETGIQDTIIAFFFQISRLQPFWIFIRDAIPIVAYQRMSILNNSGKHITS